MKSYKRAAEDKSQLQQFVDEATDTIQELKNSQSVAYIKETHDHENFSNDTINAIIEGKACAILDSNDILWLFEKIEDEDWN